MLRAYIYGVVVGLILLIAIGVTASRLQQKNPEEKEYQADLVDATPVEVGVLTEKQRIHNKLFSYKQRTNKTIREKISNPHNSESKILRMDALIGSRFIPSIETETSESYFGELAYASDAVVRGKAVKKVSQITEDGCFVFTDYDVVVSEVLKNNLTAPIDNGATITVTRPGGKVLLDGIIVKARDHAFEALPISSRDIVLFLRFIPETGAYQATKGTGSFEIDGSTLRPLTKMGYPPGTLGNKDSFLQNTDMFLQTLRIVSDR